MNGKVVHNIKLPDHLTLMNYKEPLIEIPQSEGFGYYGTLLAAKDGSTVQCHICGDFFQSVGIHARQKHKVPEKQYRERFQLARTTALISESYRERMKNNTLAWLESMGTEEYAAMKERALQASQKYIQDNHIKLSDFRWQERLETKNEKGTCPDQILEKIKEVKEQLGHVPSLKEFVRVCKTQRYKHLIFTTFGSWNNALKMLGFKTSSSSPRKYTDDELLQYLRNFVEKYKTIPTKTDCSRELLPHVSVYQRHFGSLPRARELALIS